MTDNETSQMTKLEDVEPVIEGAARDHAGIGRTVMPHTDVDYLALEREGMDGMRTYAIMEVPAMSYGNPESNISYIKKKYGIKIRKGATK